jgi:hypothetical protein
MNGYDAFMVRKKTVRDAVPVSIERAEKTLNIAWTELEEARNLEDDRQAAEKAWRAAREAVRAVMYFATGKKPGAGWLRKDRVRDFETRVLGRTSRSPQPLTLLYVQAESELHGMCFYDGACDTPLEPLFDQVEVLIHQARDDMRFLSQHPRRAGQKWGSE